MARRAERAGEIAPPADRDHELAPRADRDPETAPRADSDHETAPRGEEALMKSQRRPKPDPKRVILETHYIFFFRLARTAPDLLDSSCPREARRLTHHC